MINLQALYPQLTIERKKRLLSHVANGYTLPVKLNQELCKITDKTEEIAINFLVRDYFFYSKQPEIVKLRKSVCDEIEDIYNNNRSLLHLNDVVEKLYQPEIVKLMFEKAFENMCIECGLRNSDTVDKSYKFRDNFRRCEQDKKDNISALKSLNPIVPYIKNVVDSIYSEVMLEDTNYEYPNEKTTYR